MKASDYTYSIRLFSKDDVVGCYRWDEKFSAFGAQEKTMEQMDAINREYIINKVQLKISSSFADVLNFTYKK